MIYIPGCIDTSDYQKIKKYLIDNTCPFTEWEDWDYEDVIKRNKTYILHCFQWETWEEGEELRNILKICEAESTPKQKEEYIYL